MATQPDPNIQVYTNALLEEVNEKFEIIVEATQPIPEMQKTLAATFEEVGRLRLDVDELKRSVQDINQRLAILEAALKLLDRHEEEVVSLRDRVEKIEASLASV